MKPEQESLFYQVPLALVEDLMKYRTKNSRYTINWKNRKPVKGKQYGYGGGLRRADATTASLYVRDMEPRGAVQKVKYELFLLREKCRIQELLVEDAKRWKNEYHGVQRRLETLCAWWPVRLAIRVGGWNWRERMQPKERQS